MCTDLIQLVTVQKIYSLFCKNNCNKPLSYRHLHIKTRKSSGVANISDGSALFKCHSKSWHGDSVHNARTLKQLNGMESMKNGVNPLTRVLCAVLDANILLRVSKYMQLNSENV